MKPQYFLECRQKKPFIGDYLGQPAVTRWVVRSHECAVGGGPFQVTTPCHYLFYPVLILL